jgi:hypothetical protein
MRVARVVVVGGVVVLAFVLAGAGDSSEAWTESLAALAMHGQ